MSCTDAGGQQHTGKCVWSFSTLQRAAVFLDIKHFNVYISHPIIMSNFIHVIMIYVWLNAEVNTIIRFNLILK